MHLFFGSNPPKLPRWVLGYRYCNLVHLWLQLISGASSQAHGTFAALPVHCGGGEEISEQWQLPNSSEFITNGLWAHYIRACRDSWRYSCESKWLVMIRSPCHKEKWLAMVFQAFVHTCCRSIITAHRCGSNAQLFVCIFTWGSLHSRRQVGSARFEDLWLRMAFFSTFVAQLNVNHNARYERNLYSQLLDCEDAAMSIDHDGACIDPEDSIQTLYVCTSLFIFYNIRAAYLGKELQVHAKLASIR
jgi:hypothetical protein